jgi:hypothetical protein
LDDKPRKNISDVETVNPPIDLSISSAVEEGESPKDDATKEDEIQLLNAEKSAKKSSSSNGQILTIDDDDAKETSEENVSTFKEPASHDDAQMEEDDFEVST